MKRFQSNAEEIFCYIYAVFHAPWYREKYAEFLRLDFPRVPLPEDKSTFERYCQIGRKLVALHLMEVGAHGNAPNGFPSTARGNDDEGTLPCAERTHGHNAPAAIKRTIVGA